MNTFLEAGWTLTAMTEPPIHPDTPAELVPDGRDRFLGFLFLAFTKASTNDAETLAR